MRIKKTQHLRELEEKAQVTKMMATLDEKYLSTLKVYCGSKYKLNNRDTCPFFLPPKTVTSLGYCLAPEQDEEWSELARKKGYEETSRVIGCFIRLYMDGEEEEEEEDEPK